MSIYLKNTGTSTALGVSATLSSTDPLAAVVATSTPHSFGKMAAGQAYTPFDEFFSFKLSPSAPADHQIPFSLAISDSFGNPWTETFQVTVQ